MAKIIVGPDYDKLIDDFLAATQEYDSAVVPEKLFAKNIPAKTRAKVKAKKEIDYGLKCCYCDILLTHANISKEHVIPHHAGGKVILPSCNVCNSEKGGLFLEEYIKLIQDKLDIAQSDHEKNHRKTQIENAKNLVVIYPTKHITECGKYIKSYSPGAFYLSQYF